MGILDAILQNIWVILFYGGIAAIIFANRKKFEFQGIVAIYRTKIGIGLMDRIGRKFSGAIRVLSYVGIAAGFAVMALMAGALIYSLYQFFTVSNAPAAVAPVIPGVHVPGSTIFIPFWSGIISIFIVLVVHEFAHGLVARANRIPVKSTGYVQFLIIPGAFVEPDEKKLAKARKRTQLALFSAGAFTNFLTAIAALLVLLLLTGFAIGSVSYAGVGSAMFKPSGFLFESVEPNSSAQFIGLPPHTVFTAVNGVQVQSQQNLSSMLAELLPNDTVTFASNNASYTLIARPSPKNSSHGYLGIYDIRTYYTPKSPLLPQASVPVFSWIVEFFAVLYFLNLAIGMVNLLPLGPIDGGRMFLLAATHIFGEKRGTRIWSAVSVVMLVTILILLIPIVKAILAAIFRI